jgi:N-acetylglutamate synthase-like GNAT family acetyltransferase
VTRITKDHEFRQIKSFYQKSGYTQPISASDLFIIAKEEDKLRAALRLCREEGCLILRGIRVAPQFRRMGIGSALLGYARDVIGIETCYCIVHIYLQDFYAQIGFEQITSEAAPAFLVSRLAFYREQYDLDVILMRSGG